MPNRPILTCIYPPPPPPPSNLSFSLTHSYIATHLSLPVYPLTIHLLSTHPPPPHLSRPALSLITHILPTHPLIHPLPQIHLLIHSPTHQSPSHVPTHSPAHTPPTHLLTHSSIPLPPTHSPANIHPSPLTHSLIPLPPTHSPAHTHPFPFTHAPLTHHFLPHSFIPFSGPHSLIPLTHSLITSHPLTYFPSTYPLSSYKARVIFDSMALLGPVVPTIISFWKESGKLNEIQPHYGTQVSVHDIELRTHDTHSAQNTEIRTQCKTVLLSTVH